MYDIIFERNFFFPGYVQGMSDILSPILVVMENEVDAFWCFAGAMERVVGTRYKFETTKSFNNFPLLISLYGRKIIVIININEKNFITTRLLYIIVILKCK